MRTQWLAGSALTCLLTLPACAAMHEPHNIVTPMQQTPETMIGMLDQHLAELSTSIEGLNHRMDHLKNMPDTPDPSIRELRALDMAGWELHQQQWVLQREHLTYARTQLGRVLESPGEKAQIHEDWTKHVQKFEAAMEDFRQQRHTLEQKRLKVESQVIDQFFE